MKWTTLIQSLSSECTRTEAATEPELEAVASALGVPLPEALRGLRLETNRVEGEYGEGVIWPVERIVQDNLDFRSNDEVRDLYMPFNHLVFFADTGDGSQLACAIQAGGTIQRPDIFLWNDEDDSRSWAASSLKPYVERALSGGFDD